MSRANFIRLALVTTFIIAGGGAALAADAVPKGAVPPSSVKPLPTGINCVWKPFLRSGYFTVIDDQHIVIEADSRKYYLLTLSHRCFDIDTALGLRIDGHGDQLCGPGDSIITRRDRCQIEYLEEVSGDSEAKAIVAARAAAAKAARQSH
ncbi:MAG: DUF6491 family protein [Alphaproteobacteria bacterium]